jgi:PilZ domain
MDREQSQRQDPRKPIRRGYVEYSKSGTRLSRLFQPDIRRGPMIDVSKNGVQFRTTETIEPGDALFMTLRFPKMREPVKVKSEVSWCRDEKKVGVENYTHVIGAKFTECSHDGWELIASAMQD